MRTPQPPKPRPIEHISPTLYEALVACQARALWGAHGARDALAPHPIALLGTCFHRVMEAVQKREIFGSAEECRLAARNYFDSAATTIHSNSHPLLKLKFPTPQKLPFYNVFRERAAQLAAEFGGDPGAKLGSTDAGRDVIAEGRFASPDGLIVGRPDLIDIVQSEVIDYKTGLTKEDGGQVSEREARQLRLYAYLAREAGLDISRGTIVRGNGDIATIEISPAAADAEARQARGALAEYNSSIDNQSFQDLARPAADTCRMCPCIPMCERFWQASDTSWQDECGVHVEGAVTRVEHVTIQATDLVSLQVNVSRGTVRHGDVSIEQVPVAWTEADGDRAPEVGDVIRLVDGRLASPDEPIVVRADRIMTSLWKVRTDEAGQ